jgi:hypothetical protein
MNERFPLDDEVYLRGTLTVIVRRRDGRTCAGAEVHINGYGMG